MTPKETGMFRTLIAGAAALGLLMAAAPTTAQADDDILKGVLIGAVLGGTVAAIAKAHDRRTYAERPTYKPHRQPAYAYRRPAPQSRHYRAYRQPVVVERRVYRARPAPVVERRAHGRYRHIDR